MTGKPYFYFVLNFLLVSIRKSVNSRETCFRLLENRVTTTQGLTFSSESIINCAFFSVKENSCSAKFSKKDKLCILTPSENCFDGLVQATGEGWVTMMNIPKKEIIKTKMNYFDAQAYCQSKGGNLASFRNPYEYEAMVTMLKDNSLWGSRLWIGGSDRQQEGRFLWEGTSDELPNDPKYWLDADNFNNQDCLIILDYSVPGEFQFSDVPCSNTYFFICQF